MPAIWRSIGITTSVMMASGTTGGWKALPSFGTSGVPRMCTCGSMSPIRPRWRPTAKQAVGNRWEALLRSRAACRGASTPCLERGLLLRLPLCVDVSCPTRLQGPPRGPSCCFLDAWLGGARVAGGGHADVDVVGENPMLWNCLKVLVPACLLGLGLGCENGNEFEGVDVGDDAGEVNPVDEMGGEQAAEGSESATDESAGSEPAGEESAGNEPAADEPAADESTGNEPAADEPAADESAGNEPAAD